MDICKECGMKGGQHKMDCSIGRMQALDGMAKQDQELFGDDVLDELDTYCEKHKLM